MQAAPAIPAELAKIEGYLAMDPSNSDLLAHAIDLCLDSSQIERAAQHAAKAIALYPDQPFMRYRQGYVLLLQRQFAAAEAMLITIKDVNINVALSLAIAQQAQLKFAEVVVSLSPFQDQADFPPEGLACMMRALHHLGRLEDAVKLFQQHASRMQAEGEVLAVASLLYFDLGDAAQGQQLSQAALDLGVRNAESLITNASIALAHAETEQAITLYREVLAKNPQDGRSWSGLGMASMLRNDMAQAASELEKAVQYMPQHIGSLHILAWCKIALAEVKAAQSLFEKALELDRNFGETHGGLAVVAALQGHKQQAEASITRALRLDKECLSARYAEMLLSGVALDQERFQKIAFKIMGKRQSAFGANLAEVVRRFASSAPVKSVKAH